MNTPASRSRVPNWWPVYGILAALCWMAFWPAVNAGFSDFDDHGFLLETDHWRGLSPSHLFAIASTNRLGHYQPLTYLSHAIEFTLFGLNPAVFHSTNILLHAVCACLVARITARVVGLWSPGIPESSTRFAGLIAAALWATNPLRVENVAWLTERRDVLSGALLLGAVLAYLHTPNRRAYLWCAGLLTLSLLSKAWGITFAAVALLIDVCPLRRLPVEFWRWGRAEYRPVLLEKLPLFALGAVFAAVAIRAQAGASDETLLTVADWGPVERVCQACYGLVFYVRKTLLPTGLSPLYELPATASPTEARFAASIAAVLLSLLAVGWAAFKAGPRGLAVCVAVLVYAAVVSPVLGLTQSGIQLVADRYAYLATVPLFALLAGAVGRGLGGPPSRRLSVALGAAALTLMGAAMCVAQSRSWRDTRQLWDRAFAAGQDGPVLRNFRGRQFEKSKQFVEAEAAYRESLSRSPKYGDSWFGLGNSLRAQRRLDDALDAYAKAGQLMRDPLPAIVARGLVRVSDQARPDLAIAEFKAAVDATEARGNPGRTGSPYLLLAAAYGAAGNDAAAVEWLKKAYDFEDTRPQAEEHLREMGLVPAPGQR
ncbi:MAG: hypothetical protein ACOYN0_17090 [Phycisphaerales bacterium]